MDSSECLYCKQKSSEEYLKILEFVRTKNGIVEANSDIKSVVRVRWCENDVMHSKFFIIPCAGCACESG